MKRPLFACALCANLLLLTACIQLRDQKLPARDRNDYAHFDKTDTLYLPFDTTKVIGLLDLTFADSMPRFMFQDPPKDFFSPELDTLVLTFHQPACDCPGWYIEEEYAKQTPTEQVSMSNPVAFHISPGSEKLRLDDAINHHGNKVRFIGRRSTRDGLPAGVELIHPTPGNVFRYYAYEFIPPVYGWGPHYHTGQKETPNSTEEMIDVLQFVITAEQLSQMQRRQ